MWDPSVTYVNGSVVEYNNERWKALSNLTGVQPASPQWQMVATAAQVNQSQIISWNDYSTGYKGLVFWANFSAAHKKPFSIPEWGVWNQASGHGGGDNPYYIQVNTRNI